MRLECCNGCLLALRKDWQGRRGGGVPLYLTEGLGTTECMINDNKVVCLWARISKGSAKLTSWWMSYRPPNQDEEMDELLCKQVEDVS